MWFNSAALFYIFIVDVSCKQAHYSLVPNTRLDTMIDVTYFISVSKCICAFPIRNPNNSVSYIPLVVSRDLAHMFLILPHKHRHLSTLWYNHFQLQDSIYKSRSSQSYSNSQLPSSLRPQQSCRTSCSYSSYHFERVSGSQCHFQNL